MNEHDIEFQRKCDKFWEYNAAHCQTSLVEHLLSQEVEGFEYDDIENGFYYDEDEEDHIYAEIMEWWLIDSIFADELRKYEEPILENDYGIWWGRCTSGQAVSLDWIICKIVENREKQKKKEF